MATKVDLVTSIRAYDDSLGEKQLLNRTKAELEDMLEQMQEQYNGTDVRTPNEERAELTDDGDDEQEEEEGLEEIGDGDDERGLQAVIDRNNEEVGLGSVIYRTGYDYISEALFEAQLAQTEQTLDLLDIDQRADVTEDSTGITIDLKRQRAVVLPSNMRDLFRPEVAEQAEFVDAGDLEPGEQHIVEMQGAINRRNKPGRNSSYKKTAKAKRKQAKASRRANRR